MDSFLLYPVRACLDLNGIWEFAWTDSHGSENFSDWPKLDFSGRAAVPGVFDVGPEHCGQRGVGVYRRRVALADGAPHRLRIGGLGLRGTVLWDGAVIGETALPYSPCAFDFSPGEPGIHELIIAVDNRFTPAATPLFSPFFDFYGYGGIYRSCRLETLPSCRFEHVRVKTVTTDGLIRLYIEVSGVPDGTHPLTVSVDGSPRAALKAEFCAGRAAVELRLDRPAVWTPETPNLHTVELTGWGDAIVEQFGVRTVGTSGETLLLNGRPIRLRGFCRHEAHPEFGPVQTPQQMLGDIERIKQLGFNFIRCVHYPPDPVFLEVCDTCGMLVWAESLGWGNSTADFADPEFVRLQLAQTRQLARDTMNHPSVILRGFLNEGASNAPESHELYGRMAQSIRDVDPDFLVVYASNRIDDNAFDRCLDWADVVAFNTYPGWIGPSGWLDLPVDLIAPEIDRLARISRTHEAIAGKPVMISEIGTCALYGCRDEAGAQWSEEFQAAYLCEACRRIEAESRFCGYSLWQYCDTRTFVNAAPGVRCKPRGFNCAGVVDEYRRPKLAYRELRALFGPPATPKA